MKEKEMQEEKSMKINNKIKAILSDIVATAPLFWQASLSKGSVFFIVTYSRGEKKIFFIVEKKKDHRRAQACHLLSRK